MNDVNESARVHAAGTRRLRSAVRISTASLTVACAFVALGGCASEKGLWSKGAKYFLLETTKVQMRRSAQRLDKPTGEVHSAWVAVRAQDGEPDLLEVVLTVFNDRNGNGLAEPAEIVKRRESFERCRKVSFDELRFPTAVEGRPLTAHLFARTRRVREEVSWTLEPD